MVNRGGKICLAAFPHEPVPVDVAFLVRNNIYLYGIRGEGKSATHRAEAFMRQKRFDATKIHTHTFALEDLPTALRYARERIEDAIKVVVKARGVAQRGGEQRAARSEPARDGCGKGRSSAMLICDQYLTPASLDEAFAAMADASRPASHRRRRHRYLALGARRPRRRCRDSGADRCLRKFRSSTSAASTASACGSARPRPSSAFSTIPRSARALPAMPRCAVWFADDQIRESATIGGNIVNASPAGDAIPPLIAHDAVVELASRRDGKIVPTQDAARSSSSPAPARPSCSPTNCSSPSNATRCPAMAAASRRSATAARW